MTMRVKDYQAILKAASDVLGYAMHIVDSDGITIFYNNEMASLEKINVNDALGKPFREVFSSIPEEESTFRAALKERKSTLATQQTYLNAYGKEVTTVNSTVPIIVDGKVVAAIEVAKDITDIKDLSNTILDLRSGILPAGDEEPAAGSDAPKGIKKYHFDDIIGKDRAFEEILARAKKASRNDVTVLINGETGTGKELFA